MPTVLWVVMALGAAVALGVVVRRFARAYFRARGQRVITCPENEEFAAVEVDARRAAQSALFGHQHVQLRDCSRWPEKQGCGQECLSQIEASPTGCLVRSMLDQWYAGSTCAVCSKEIGAIDWFKHKPALMSPDRHTVAWNAIPAETLPEVLATHFPVCWDCHVVESVVREHSDRIVVRPPHRGPGIPGPLSGGGGESQQPGGAARAS
jgi:hypothetical protein